MKSTLFSKQLQITPAKDKLNQQRYPANLNKSTRGFTLLEVLVTIVIVGILSAIAAPSWLGFVARQRLNKANDSVLAAVQDAQRQAKKNKRSYSVSIQLNNSIPQVSVHPESTPPPTTSISWRDIGADLEIKPGQLLLFTNLDGNDDASDDAIDYTDASTLDSAKTITFDYKGGLELPANISDKGSIIALALPKVDNNNQASNTKRCIIVQTLIGGIRTAKNDECD